tara:strand:+ start:609 stop:1556 length:948 start_codon:yes stop_codon:yes gene_type:complete
MKATYIVDKFDLKIEKPENAKFVSFSQFSSFKKCEHYWKLCHIDKLRDKEDTIHTVFGTAMHNVVQHWLQVLYTKTVKEADALDFKELLSTDLRDQYMIAVEKMGRHFSTPEELSEFFSDGLLTLEYLRKKRTEYFDRKNEELIGTEVPLLIVPDSSKPNVYLMGYLDIVLRDKITGKIKMPDLKTSKEGWKKWDKDDKVKTSQVILYKIYFSKQYNVPEEDIEGSYLILKRKLYEDSLYPQKRTQTFSPPQGSISRNQVQREFQKFLDACFLPDGSYNTLYQYRPITGRNCFNCRFCEFRDREDLCPTDKRITL